MMKSWRRCVTTALLLCAAGLVVTPLTPRVAQSQGVFLQGPPETLLPSVTPAFALTVAGLGPARPLQITLQVSTTSSFIGIVLDSTFTSMDTVVTIQVTRPLPPQTVIFARARVRALAGFVFESAIYGPRTVPAWVTLTSLNSPTGMKVDSRRPLFEWRSPEVSPLVGPWRYDIELEAAGRLESGANGLTGTNYRPAADLQTNTSYRWALVAKLGTGAAMRVESLGSFVIDDPALPRATLLYQNFPNPFPSDAGFNTCFWFDIGAGGAEIALDVLDLRGNMVRRIIPDAGGRSRFDAGRYGRGVVGGDGNCDGRFTWDGTASDGRTVAPGVYIVRFRANRGAPTFRRIVFRGR